MITKAYAVLLFSVAISAAQSTKHVTFHPATKFAPPANGSLAFQVLGGNPARTPYIAFISESRSDIAMICGAFDAELLKSRIFVPKSSVCGMDQTSASSVSLSAVEQETNFFLINVPAGFRITLAAGSNPAQTAQLPLNTSLLNHGEENSITTFKNITGFLHLLSSSGKLATGPIKRPLADLTLPPTYLSKVVRRATSPSSSEDSWPADSILIANVDAQGRLKDLKVLSTQSNEILRLQEIARKWQWLPYQFEGKAVDYKISIPGWML